MRTIIIFLLFLLLFSGCKKEKYGTVIYKIKYTTSNEFGNKMKSNALIEESYYTQFGDFITSVTPSSFIGHFHLLRIHGTVNDTDSPPVFMTMFLSHTWPFNIADFSNNAELTVIPTLSGPFVHGPDDQPMPYFENDAYFKFLHVNIQNIEQVIELPVQYDNIDLDQFDCDYGNNHYSCDSVKIENILSVDMFPLTWKIYDSLDIFKYRLDFYFGLINQTTLYVDGNGLPFPTELNQSDFDMPIPFVWSNKFNEWILKPPVNGETVTVNFTIGFDNRDLIHIYAGADNISYTSDDIIIYAPNFWDRIYVNITSE